MGTKGMRRRKRRVFDRRTERVEIRVSPRELVTLQMDAEGKGLSVGAYLMALAIGRNGLADEAPYQPYVQPGPGQGIHWDEQKREWVLVEHT